MVIKDMLHSGNSNKYYFIFYTIESPKKFEINRVNGSSFQGFGIGAYCYFRDHAVTVANGIMTSSDAKMVDPLR